MQAAVDTCVWFTHPVCGKGAIASNNLPECKCIHTWLYRPPQNTKCQDSVAVSLGTQVHCYDCCSRYEQMLPSRESVLRSTATKHFAA